MYSLLAMLLFTITPPGGVPCDYVERLETNHFYDDGGRLVFTQLIGWEANETVRAWRMVKDTNQTPQRDHAGGGYVVLWLDEGQVRKVHAQSVRETWSQYDVEIFDRQFRPAELRRNLKR